MTTKFCINNNVPKSSWLKQLHSYRIDAKTKKYNSITFDLTACGFFAPFHTATLACLIEEIYLQGVNIKFAAPYKSDVHSYFNKINFYNYWSKHVDRNVYCPATVDTTLNLWKISHSMISSYSNVSQNYFRTNYLYDSDLTPLNICLSELFNNIYDHACSPIDGFTITQFYPTKHTLDICVCDFGMGIPAVVNNFLKNKTQNILPDHESIAKAFENKFSTKSTPRNKGLGLANLEAIVKSCNGKLKVYSQKGVHAIHDLPYTSTTDLIHGTVFDISLDANSFNAFDENEHELLEF